MPETIARKILYAQTRADLFDLGHGLAGILPPAALLPKGPPLVVAVIGSYSSGKSILAECLRDMFATPENGTKLPRDIVMHGTLAGQPAAVGYIDSAYPDGYEDKDIDNENDQTMREAMFMLKNRTASMIIIQNMSAKHLKRADIVLWVENDFQTAPGKNDWRNSKEKFHENFDTARPRLRDVLADAQWLRYVEVDIQNFQLRRNQKFMQALDKLCDKKNQHPAIEATTRVARAGEKIRRQMPAPAATAAMIAPALQKHNRRLFPQQCRKRIAACFSIYAAAQKSVGAALTLPLRLLTRAPR